MQGFATVIDANVAYGGDIRQSRQLWHFTLIVVTWEWIGTWPTVGVDNDEKIDRRVVL